MEKVKVTKEEADFFNNHYIKTKELRHSTPEEIAEEKEQRFWNKHGRDVWELKTRDVLWDPVLKEAVVVDHIDDMGQVHYSNGDHDQPEDLRGNYKVICFAEDRKDVKNND